MPDNKNSNLLLPDKSGFVGTVLVWLPAIIYVSLILIMSTRPAPGLPYVKQIDKLFHAMAYAVLAIFFYRSFYKSGFRAPAILTVVFAIAIGATDEAIQAFNPFRTASLLDLFADGVGAAFGTFAGRKIMSLHQRN